MPLPARSLIELGFFLGSTKRGLSRRDRATLLTLARTVQAPLYITNLGAGHRSLFFTHLPKRRCCLAVPIFCS
jgi:hypothetical protein